MKRGLGVLIFLVFTFFSIFSFISASCSGSLHCEYITTATYGRSASTMCSNNWGNWCSWSGSVCSNKVSGCNTISDIKCKSTVGCTPSESVSNTSADSCSDIYYCVNYLTSADCKANLCGVFDSSVSSKITCGKGYICGCYWNITVNQCDPYWTALFDNSTCIPDCKGKECGGDSCGGVCGSCSNPHGTSSCSSSGLCQPACSSGYANCDNDESNGCETQFGTNFYCSSCTDSCSPSQICVNNVCETQEVVSSVPAIPIGENKKNIALYPSKEVFLISDKNWENVLSLVPLTTWTGSEICNKGYGTPRGVCVYPTLIYHEEDYSFDTDSIIYFMQQYSANKVTIAGNTPNDLDNLLIAQPDFGAGISSKNINRISSADYLNYWSSYKDVVYVEDNYELALVASTYASLMDAPLIIKGTDLDVDSVFSGRNVICVTNYVDSNSGNTDVRGTGSRRDPLTTTTTSLPGLQRTCNEKYTLKELQQKYVSETNTDKIILVNPGDLNIHVNDYLHAEKSSFYILNLYGGTSLVAPILASAKHELIISSSGASAYYTDSTRGSPSTMIGSNSMLASFIGGFSRDIGMSAKYLTIIAAPNAIENRMYSYNSGGNDIYIALDQNLYGQSNGLYTGRIMGLTLSDVSGYVARDLFYNSLPNADHVLFMASSRDQDINNAIRWAQRFINDGYSVEIETHPDVAYKFNPELWEKYNYQMISYQDHGGEDWLGIYSSEIPKLNKAFVVADACSTVSTYEFDSFWANAIRKGGIGFLGAVGVGFTTTAPMYKDTINGIYHDGLSIGEAFWNSYKDNVFDNFLNINILDQYKYMTTLVGDPTLNIAPSNKLKNALE